MLQTMLIYREKERNEKPNRTQIGFEFFTEKNGNPRRTEESSVAEWGWWTGRFVGGREKKSENEA
jgi:hypothetical protein